MRAIIFANGPLGSSYYIRSYIQPGDLLIAADGGANHTKYLGITPDIAVGDFDSLSASVITEMEISGVQFLRFPQRKDFTDLELAFQLAIEKGANEIIVFAALGSRWDMTLANLLLPAAESFRKAQVRLVDGRQEISLLHSGETLWVSGQPGDTISLIPVGGDTSGITTRGLEYPLNHETLYLGSSRGVSNVLNGAEGQITIENGLLICVTIHQIDMEA
jgi:thiamine pyrophosphokinase